MGFGQRAQIDDKTTEAVKGMRLLFFVLLVASIVANARVLVNLPPATQLLVEYVQSPVFGVDVAQPRFSWAIPGQNGPKRGQVQTAYQILVASDSKFSTIIWDSGVRAGNQSSNVIYQGSDLQSGLPYYWKVRYWIQSAQSDDSEVATFTTGILSNSEWVGKWIRCATLPDCSRLRKVFTLEVPSNFQLTGATAFFSGIGYGELYINNQRVGDKYLDPAWTTYNNRVLYSTYDITSLLLVNQSNTIGILLGFGWYGKLGGVARAMLQIQLNFNSPSVKLTQSFGTDTTWLGSNGPIRYDDVWYGEVYDARLEDDWLLPSYNTSKWEDVVILGPPSSQTQLSSQMMPAIKIVDQLKPISITQPIKSRPQYYVIDFGQNLSGFLRIKVKGPRGANVTLQHAELLFPNGTLNRQNLLLATATDVYILNGQGVETYNPRFTYHGFQFASFEASDPSVTPPTLDTIVALSVHTSVPQRGSFKTSNDLINRIQSAIVWTQKDNLMSVPTDCDQRSEREGWMADASVSAEQAMHNFWMPAFYTNWLREIRDASVNGLVADTSPHFYGLIPADPAWGAAYPMILSFMYQYFGDQRILEDHYDSLKQWIQFFEANASKSANGLVTYTYYGDWLQPGQVPADGDFVSSWEYYYQVSLFLNIAQVLGKKDDVTHYAQLLPQIKNNFNKAYYNTSTKTYKYENQMSFTLPLFAGLVPDADRSQVAKGLIQSINDKQSHVDTGIISTKFLMLSLSELGFDQVALDLAVQTSYPSWGYMILSNATTIWERWEDMVGYGMNSHNHPALSSVGDYFYKYLAGIRQQRGTVGFEAIEVRPVLVAPRLTSVSASMATLRGNLSVAWQFDTTSKCTSISVTIPGNSKALCAVPSCSGVDPKQIVIREGGNIVYAKGTFVAGTSGVTGASVSADGLYIDFNIGSGTYNFVAALK